MVVIWSNSNKILQFTIYHCCYLFIPFSMSYLILCVYPLFTVSLLDYSLARLLSMAVCLNLKRVSSFFSDSLCMQFFILSLAESSVLTSKASTNFYSSSLALLINLETTSSFEIMRVISPNYERSCYLQLCYFSSRYVLLIEICEGFIYCILKRDVWGCRRVLVRFATAFLGVVIGVFLKATSLLQRPSIILFIYLESSLYSISKLTISFLGCFFSALDPCKSILTILSSMMEAYSVLILLPLGLTLLGLGCSCLEGDGVEGIILSFLSYLSSARNFQQYFSRLSSSSSCLWR